MKIIAEIGQNHNGDMGLACELIHAAHENGADCAKFQVYDALALFPRENNEWYDYNCKTELSRKDVQMLANECQKIGIEFMASVFDIERIDWLEDVGVRQYKVASRSIHDKVLLDALCGTGKPLLVSLGMWDNDQFPEFNTSGEVDFLYCISNYPTVPEDLKLTSVDFTKYAGFSDHTIGISAPVAACALGAKTLEKHLTLDKNMYGPDHSGSMTPDELANIVNISREIECCL